MLKDSTTYYGSKIFELGTILLKRLKQTLLTWNSLQIADSLSQSTRPKTIWDSSFKASDAASKIGCNWRENLNPIVRSSGTFYGS